MEFLHNIALVFSLSMAILYLSHANEESGNQPEDYLNAHSGIRRVLGAPPLTHCEASANSAQSCVDAHNVVRKELGLEPMTWDPTVAQFAEDYANQRKHDCALVHSDTKIYGENIATGSGDQFSLLDAIKMWVSEKADYNYESNTCTDGKMCGHYTQVVWRNSTRLGCARVKCPNNGIFMTCNYDPPGNYIDTKPY